jgi:subtilisin-like proprotein convertase family protein
MRLHRHVARLAALSLVGLGLGAGVTALGTAASAASGTYSSPSAIAINTRVPEPTNTTPTTIPGSGTATPYPSQIVVAGQPGTITDVDVNLTLTHTFPDDVDMLLVGPSGQRVVILSDVGGGGGLASAAFSLNDESGTPLPDNTAISAGTDYQPTNVGVGDVFPAPAPDATAAGSSLTAYDGDSPNGVWSLYVLDDLVALSGQVDSWGLTITTDLTLPVAATAYPSTVTVAGALNGVTDVNLVLTGYSHTFPDHVDMMLVGPQNQRAMVMSDIGGSLPVSSVNLTLDDQAAAALPDSTQLSSGTFQPTNIGATDTVFPAPAPLNTGAGTPLSVFNGTNPNGVWSLYVVDDGSLNQGSFAGGWALQISTVDAPAAPVISAPASGSRDRDGVFAMAGSGPANATIKVLEGATTRATTTSSALGQWATTVSGATNGSHTFTATATDSLGNVSAASPGVVVIVDSVGPAVSKTTPKKGAKAASRTASIKATTNEAVRKLTVTKAHAFITVAGSTTHLKAKVSWKPGTRTIVINPKADLRAGTTYKVTITTKIKDLAGNPLDQKKTKSGLQKKTWKFTTR